MTVNNRNKPANCYECKHFNNELGFCSAYVNNPYSHFNQFMFIEPSVRNDGKTSCSSWRKRDE